MDEYVCRAFNEIKFEIFLSISVYVFFYLSFSQNESLLNIPVTTILSTSMAILLRTHVETLVTGICHQRKVPCPFSFFSQLI